jgi:phage baseplate assembly protein W
MAQTAPLPGTGVDRATGMVLSGWPHVRQSLGVIFTTYFGERVLRRWFGSFVPKLLGQNMTPSTILRFWTAICIAVELWEPRYKITAIVPVGDAETMREGALGFRIEGQYRPRGHLGDFTPAPGVFTMTIGRTQSGATLTKN